VSLASARRPWPRPFAAFSGASDLAPAPAGSCSRSPRWVGGQPLSGVFGLPPAPCPLSPWTLMWALRDSNLWPWEPSTARSAGNQVASRAGGRCTRRPFSGSRCSVRLICQECHLRWQASSIRRSRPEPCHSPNGKGIVGPTGQDGHRVDLEQRRVAKKRLQPLRSVCHLSPSFLCRGV